MEVLLKDDARAALTPSCGTMLRENTVGGYHDKIAYSVSLQQENSVVIMRML